jgi:phosphatidylglycerophosphatase C
MMGIAEPSRQSDDVPRPIVAFDFDGTLTWRDSFTAFLAWRTGAARYGFGLARLTPAAILYGLHRDRGRLKAAAIGQFLGGLPRAELEADARRFATRWSARLLRPDALRCWNDWRSQGARRIVVTASPEILVAPFAQDLEADDLIGTRVAFDAEGRVTGALEGANCRGPEKVARLQAALGVDVRLEAAYGDSDGDREMLALADDAGLRVFRQRP